MRRDPAPSNWCSLFFFNYLPFFCRRYLLLSSWSFLSMLKSTGHGSNFEGGDELMFSSCMATGRVEETGILDSGAPAQHIAYGLLNGMPSSTNFSFDHHGTAFQFGELEEALVPKFLQGDGVRHDEMGKSQFPNRPPTLEIFPSWPMRYQQITPKSADSTDTGSAQNTVSCKADMHLEPESPISKKGSDQSTSQRTEMATDVSRRKGADGSKIQDHKTLRRLAQNREAAKKSRLKKKAYVQQLETSSVKLAQLEQDLQRAKSQGLFIGGGAGPNVTSGAAMFDMEYARWQEDNNRHMTELRGGLHAHLSDTNLRAIVDGCLAHYDDLFRLKAAAANADVFHLLTGVWTSPAERCFLWMGGFRPSELVKILVPQLDPLTEQQVVGICGVQHSSQQAEEALSQGFEQLQQSLADTVANGSVGEGGAHVGDYMNQMVLALGKLSNLEGFVRQADNLRQQTLHQMRQILTVRQAARCFLAIGEYHSRLRALSSLWASRPHESMTPEESCRHTSTGASTSDLQVNLSPHSHHIASL